MFLATCWQTIDWIMKTEEGFFPKLAGELGSSLSDVKQQQKRLEDFKPTIVVSNHHFHSLIYTLLLSTLYHEKTTFGLLCTAL